MSENGEEVSHTNILVKKVSSRMGSNYKVLEVGANCLCLTNMARAE